MTEVRTTARNGRGVFALRPFAPGELLLEFTGRTFLPQAGEHTLQVGPGRHLVVEPPGCFVNHSCGPNAGIHGSTRLVAMRAIPAGAEITFDYAMTELHSVLAEVDCLCGSTLCRKRVTGFAGLPQTVKERYHGFISAYLAEINPGKCGE